MKIHSDILTADDVREAASKAGCTVPAGIGIGGSRSRKFRLEFWLSGTGREGGQFGITRGRTATWDEWGIALAELFRRDPAARVPSVYEGAEHFHWATDDRYVDLSVDAQHVRHRWESDGERHPHHYEQVCRCGAVRRTFRQLVTGESFSGQVVA